MDNKTNKFLKESQAYPEKMNYYDIKIKNIDNKIKQLNNKIENNINNNLNNSYSIPNTKGLLYNNNTFNLNLNDDLD